MPAFSQNNRCRVAGGGDGKSFGLQVKVYVTGRGEHGEVRALKNTRKLTIEVGKEQTRRVCQAHKLLQQASQHGGYQCCLYAVPHDVTYQHAHTGISHGEYFKAVAGHSGAGAVDMVELGGAFNPCLLVFPFAGGYTLRL